MYIRFDIEYHTIFGEDLFMNILSHDGSARAHAMHTRDGIIWSIELDVPQAIEYYYTVTWEGREKRTEWMLCPHSFDPKEVTDPTLPAVQRDAWMDAPEDFRIAGTLIPVFSLRSRRSFGVGDFGDLKQMVDWVASTGQRILQILPINDTTNSHTWMDSYPYSCISVFALHPQYVDLNALPPLHHEADRKRFDILRQELNALPQLDYERVNAAKLEYLMLLFEQEGERMLGSEAFKTFFEENKDWLAPYAEFCVQRETQRSTLNPQLSTLNFYYFVQFILATQLAAVHAQARARGVLLKGDIPIGVDRNGCDVWQEPRYFNLNGQAGAPPDDFAVDGQNWGFPTYNWDEMLRDGCKWWERRFRNMARYFDAYRIDHVLGFFRIWEIPLDSVHGLLGHFAPALPMTVEEIESYGLPWREQTYTQPYITDRILHRIFGDDTAEVRRLYLEPQENGHYRLRSDYDTQRKVQAHFGDKQDAHTVKLRDGLYTLISNVLFLRDKEQPDHFHPRIVAMHDFLYEDLGDWEKDAFNRIHDHYFHHRHNQFWYDESMKKLPQLVDATRMLVCAEDLGMIPECVGWVMDRLGILTLEIQTMPKKAWQQFANLWENPYRSVATISTHDMPTMRGWWDEQRETAQQYYNNMLYHEGQAPHPMTGAVAEEIVSRHLESPSMLCLLSLQDWLAIDEQVRYPDPDAERINVPANPRHYWQWRMHLTIEQLMANTALNEKIRGLVKSYGR